MAVSIHAPTWGATQEEGQFDWQLCFNPRTHMGCDNLLLGHSISLSEFQSTHPHGVRHVELLFSITKV